VSGKSVPKNNEGHLFDAKAVSCALSISSALFRELRWYHVHASLSISIRTFFMEENMI